MAEETKNCTRCGAAMVSGAAFCSSCGTPVSEGASSTGVRPPTPFAMRREKHEKNEKQEKREKGEKHEKGGDRGGAVVGGLILIWLGFSLYLDQIQFFPGAAWWAYFLSGLGVILILSGIIRRTRAGQPLTGSVIGGAILLVIGLTGLLRIGSFWPWVLVLLGIVVIISGMTARRRSPQP